MNKEQGVAVAPQKLKLTLGQFRVGLSFNPSKNPVVDDIKIAGAKFIDLIQDEVRRKIDPTDPLAGELIRLCAHAQTLVEDAAMNAVKAATKDLSVEVTNLK